MSKCDLNKICIKFSGEHPCRSVISIKYAANLQENTRPKVRFQ